MTTQNPAVRDYLQHLHALYADMRRWLEDKGLRIDSESVEIHEERIAKYAADQLLIIDPDGETTIARVRPVGQNILGASGRVDLVGNQGKESLLYLNNGETSVKTASGPTSAPTPKTKRIVPGVKGDGWYWMEGRTNRRAHSVDETLFLEFLSDVSGHVF